MSPSGAGRGPASSRCRLLPPDSQEGDPLGPLWGLRATGCICDCSPGLSVSDPGAPVSRPSCQPNPDTPRAELPSVLSAARCPVLFRPKEGSKENGGARSKRALEEEEGGADVLSKNKQKKQLRNPHKTFDPSLKRKLLLDPGRGRPRVT